MPLHARVKNGSVGSTDLPLAVSPRSENLAVSRWENGHDTIGRQADGLLRLMVALEPPKVDYHAEELAKIRDEVKPAAVRLEPRSRGWAEARA